MVYSLFNTQQYILERIVSFQLHALATLFHVSCIYMYISKFLFMKQRHAATTLYIYNNCYGVVQHVDSLSLPFQNKQITNYT